MLVLLTADFHEATRDLVLARRFHSETEGEREVDLSGLVTDEVDSVLEALSPVGHFLSCTCRFQKYSSQNRRIRQATQRLSSLGAVAPKQSYRLLSLLEKGMNQLDFFFFSPAQLASPMCFSSYSERNSRSKCDLLIGHAKQLLTSSVTSGSLTHIFPAAN